MTERNDGTTERSPWNRQMGGFDMGVLVWLNGRKNRLWKPYLGTILRE